METVVDQGGPIPPVQALPYFTRQDEPWLAVVRLGAWAAIISGAVTLAWTLFDVAIMIAMTTGVAKSPTITFPSARYLLFEIVPTACAVTVVVGGGLARSLRPKGRALVVWGSGGRIVWAVIATIINIVSIAQMTPNYGAAYAAFNAAHQMGYAVQQSLVSVFLIVLFTRPAVKEVMRLTPAA